MILVIDTLLVDACSIGPVLHLSLSRERPGRNKRGNDGSNQRRCRECLRRYVCSCPSHFLHPKLCLFAYYPAASDSMSALTHSFILAMTCYPEIQKRIHHELDEVLGGYRLPIHEDRPDLPYLSAAITEVFRYVTALKYLLNIITC
jgi:hypothetical protein